jgi:WXG100 family type VII secretion target
MSDMLIQPDELNGAAEQFDQASKNLEEIVSKLDETTANLKDKWEAASQQVFFKQYSELRQYMDGMRLLLGHISLEMKAMAERFEQADR